MIWDELLKNLKGKAVEIRVFSDRPVFGKLIDFDEGTLLVEDVVANPKPHNKKAIRMSQVTSIQEQRRS